MTGGPCPPSPRRGFQADGEAVTIDPARRQDYDSLVQHCGPGGELPAKVLHLWGVTGAEPGFARGAGARGCSA